MSGIDIGRTLLEHIPTPDITPGQERAVGAAVVRILGQSPAAVEVLEALGFAPYVSAPVIHGTETGLDQHEDDGTPLCKRCRQWATATAELRAILGRPTWECGTPAAARRHRAVGEPLCEPCRLAENAYANARRRQASAPEHGSKYGCQAHHRAGEPLCDLCAAWAAVQRSRSKVPPGSRCGTTAGDQIHQSLGEKTCEPCRRARLKDARGWDEHRRELRQARKSAKTYGRAA